MILYPKSYCVFDFETSGLSHETNKIIEIGALRVEEGKKDEQCSWLLNWPSLDLPDNITMITGINKQMLETFGLKPELAWYQFFEFTKGLPLIGHNIIKFDLLFLEIMNLYVGDSSSMFDMAQIKRNCVDTAALYKARKLQADRMWNESLYAFCARVLEIRMQGLKYNVGVACDELGIDRKDAKQHRAEGDVYLTHEIYKKICLKKTN